jgi:ribosomal protein S14
MKEVNYRKISQIRYFGLLTVICNICHKTTAVFWDVGLCRSCVNRRFGGTYRLHLPGRKISERGTSVSRWLQTEPPVELIPELSVDFFFFKINNICLEA